MLQMPKVFWHCMMYCNSCVNPFIYNHSSQEFRDGFRDVMSRWLTNSTGGTGLTTGQGARPANNAAATAGGQRVGQ